MKALITGAGGFVGGHLANHLQATGDEVLSTDLSNAPDLRDAPGWQQKLSDTKPDVVYHLAGWSDVGASWNAPIETYEINLMGTINVLEACHLVGVEVVIIVSSADVYGTVATDDLPLVETSPTRPRSPYGGSKLAAEKASLQYWRGFGLNSVIVRPFNHFGPGQSTRFAAPSFAVQVAKAESQGHGTIRTGDLSPKRDFTDVRDVVRAYRLLAEAARSPERAELVSGEVFNVCSGTSITMKSLLDAMIAQATVPIEISLDPDLLRPVELAELRGSAAKLEAITGWRPTIEISTTISDLLDRARGADATPDHNRP